MLSRVICGYILFDGRGNPILIDADDRYVGRQDIFAGVIEFIYLNMGRIRREMIDRFDLLGFTIYVGFLGDFLLAVISDTRDPRVRFALIDILRNIYELGYSGNLIFSNIVAKERVRRIISGGFSLPSPNIDRVRDLAERMMLCMEEAPRSTELGVDTVYFRIGQVRPKIKTTWRHRKKTRNIDDILEYYLKGMFDNVVKYAPSMFDEGDTPKILYVKASINLMRSGRSTEPPSVERINSVIDMIDDPLAKEYLRLSIGMFIGLDAFQRISTFLKEKREELLSRINSIDETTRIVYSILLADAPIWEIMETILWVFEEKSGLFSTRLLSSIFDKDITTTPPRTIESWRGIYNTINRMFEESTHFKGEVPQHYFYMLQLIALWGLTVDGQTFRQGLELLGEFSLMRRENIERILVMRDVLPAPIVIKTIYMFAIITDMIISILSVEGIEKILKNSWDILRRILVRIIDNRMTYRISMDLYGVIIAGLLGVLSKISLLRGEYIVEIPRLVREVAQKDIEHIWSYNRTVYAQIYLGLCLALANNALMLPTESPRILIELSEATEELIDLLPRSNLMRTITIVKTIEFLTRSTSNECEERTKYLLRKYLEDIPTFFLEYLKRIIHGSLPQELLAHTGNQE